MPRKCNNLFAVNFSNPIQLILADSVSLLLRLPYATKIAWDDSNDNINIDDYCKLNSFLLMQNTWMWRTRYDCLLLCLACQCKWKLMTNNFNLMWIFIERNENYAFRLWKCLFTRSSSWKLRKRFQLNALLMNYFPRHIMCLFNWIWLFFFMALHDVNNYFGKCETNCISSDLMCIHGKASDGFIIIFIVFEVP